MTLRLAMWSGPRNISTAMMRAWENREDTRVVDEPFYACYLHATGIDHPMREEVIASQSTDWSAVARMLTEDCIPESVFYQKHMTHHMLEGSDLRWVRDLAHCFLIRDPRDVVASYAEKRETISMADIGIKRQYELYQEISNLSKEQIPVLDAQRFLEKPERSSRALCAALGIEFSSRMLRWPAGGRKSDGIWAPHWYQSVEASTGFAAYRARRSPLLADQQRVVDESMVYYKRLLEVSWD